MRRSTKTRTRSGRLSWLDRYLTACHGDALRGALVVDLGFGKQPVTAFELAEAIAPFGARVIGVEPDPAVVAAAAALPGKRAASVSFRTGGFALEDVLLAGECPRVVRVANVLRGYREEEVELARGQLAASLPEGGLLLDATCDLEGHAGSALVLRRVSGALSREALVFATDFSRGFAPRAFRDWLPRDLRRRAGAETAVGRFLSSWEERWRPLRSLGPSVAFTASVCAHPELHLVAEGLARWAPPGGVPAPELPSAA